MYRERRARFRAHLAGGRCLIPASIFDPFSIRLAEDIGFEIGMMGGSSASLAVLGAPDLIVLTLTEFADQCRRMSRASPLMGWPGKLSEPLQRLSCSSCRTGDLLGVTFTFVLVAFAVVGNVFQELGDINMGVLGIVCGPPVLTCFTRGCTDLLS